MHGPSHPRLSLYFPLPTPCPQAGQALVLAALQIGEAMFHIRCRHFPPALSLLCSRRPGHCLLWGCSPHMRPKTWALGAECESHTQGGRVPCLSRRGPTRACRPKGSEGQGWPAGGQQPRGQIPPGALLPAPGSLQPSQLSHHRGVEARKLP